MAQTKYDTHVAPRLEEITGWARNGVIDKDIAKNLGIAYSTFKTYKKENEALSDALKDGKEVIDLQVENALLKRALGMEYEEEKVYIEEKDGVVKKKKEITKKYLPGDTTAMIFWLKNRRPDVWRDRKHIDNTITSAGDIEISIGGIDIESLGDD